MPRNEEREEKLDYLAQYSCRPPPLFLISLTLGQLAVFVYHVSNYSSGGGNSSKM